MEDKIVTGTLISHLSAGRTAVACVALGYGPINHSGHLDEIARVCGEILREAGAILAPWRAGVLIACWGSGNRGCALRAAARGLLDLREQIEWPGPPLTLRLSLDVCEAAESPLSHRREFSRIIGRTVAGTLSCAMNQDRWFVSSAASASLESLLRFEKTANGSPWKLVAGRQERSSLAFDWDSARLPGHGANMDTRNETSADGPRGPNGQGGTRELVLADCASPVPILLAR